MTKSRTRQSQYKGQTVVVRWTEVKAVTERALFIASYSIVSAPSSDAAWHHNSAPLFHTFETAADYALKQAMHAIDIAS
jgi:hypothetical protein